MDEIPVWHIEDFTEKVIVDEIRLTPDGSVMKGRYLTADGYKEFEQEFLEEQIQELSLGETDE